MLRKLRKALAGVLSAVALVALAGFGAASADDYPSKPITLIVPFGAGGSHDLNARVFTSVIPEYLGQPMVVKLMPGAGGQKGTAAAINAPADGYTLLFTHNFIDQLQKHTENLPYDPIRDMRTVWKLNDSESLVYVRSDKPWTTLPELLAYGKKHPGELVFPNSGKWGASFTSMAVVLADQGVRVKFVPYKGGGPARRALLAGDGDFTIGRISHVMSGYRAGDLRILAVAGDKRLEDLPEVPSFMELGYPSTGGVMDRIVMAPAGVPQDRIDKLRAAFARLYEDRTFKSLIRQLGENLNFMDGPDYEKVRLRQTEAYAELVKKLTGQ